MADNRPSELPDLATSPRFLLWLCRRAQTERVALVLWPAAVTNNNGDENKNEVDPLTELMMRSVCGIADARNVGKAVGGDGLETAEAVMMAEEKMILA